MANNTLGNLGIPPIGNANAINNLLRDLQTFKLTEKQILRNNSLESVYQGIPAFGNQGILAQNPASSHLQAPISNAFFLANCRASINDQLEQLRNTAIRDLWHDVPGTVGTQILFQMKLIDASPRFIIPVQIALSFFPRLVYSDYENILVTSMDKKLWTMIYAYNSGTNNFEFITGWDTFLEHYSLGIGDYVIFYVHRSHDLSVKPIKRETVLQA